MIQLLLLGFITSPETPKEALEASFKHYQSLSSFSATVESHDASGLYPGNFTQSLKWKKGNRFELVTIKKSDFVASPGNPGSVVTDFFSNGSEVLIRRADGTTSTRDIDPGPNTSPGWEVASGLPFGWLLNSHASKMILNPPKEFKIDYLLGERKHWEGMDVREIVLDMSQGGRTHKVSVFLEANGKHFLGHEYQENGKKKWQKHADIKDNPELPTTLGDHPK
jgi:hypothetical protein